MGIASRIGGAVGSVGSTVMTRYRADVSDHKRKLRDLSGAQKKQMKQQIETLQKQNDALDVNIAKIGKVALAVTAVGGAYVALQKAQKVYIRETILQTASATASINKMAIASEGLITNTELMTLASSTLNSELGITQAELETAAAGIVALVRGGKDMTTVIKDVTKSLTEGGSEEMQKYGILVKDLEGNLIGKGKEGQAGVIAGLGRMADMMRDKVTPEVDRAKQAIVRQDNAISDLGQSLGQLANTILPPILDNFTELARLILVIVDGYRQFGELIGNAGKGTAARPSGDARKLDPLFDRRKEILKILGNIDRQDSGFPVDVTGVSALRNELAGIQSKIDAITARQNARTGQFTSGTPHTGGGIFGHKPGGVQKPFGLSPDLRGKGGAGRTTDFDFGFVGPINDLQDLIAAEQARTGQPGLITSLLLGPGGMGDVESPVIHQIRAAKEEVAGLGEVLKDMATGEARVALDSFSSAMGQAWGAMITGSESAGTAFKKAFGQMVLSQSMMLFGTGVTEGVMALVSLARLDGTVAAFHGKASAAAFAGAAVLGTLAASMGAGGATGSPGGAGGIGSFRIGASGAEQTIHKTFFIGDSFFDRSPRQRAAKMSELISSEATSDGVEFV